MKRRDSFKKCPFVTNGIFNAELARQLFYGFENDTEIKFTEGFCSFNDSFDYSEPEKELEHLIDYMNYIGITVSKNILLIV